MGDWLLGAVMLAVMGGAWLYLGVVMMKMRHRQIEAEKYYQRERERYAAMRRVSPPTPPAE